MKKRKLCIDADFVIFQATEGKSIKDNTFGNEKVKLKPFKERFKKIIQDIEDEVAVAYLGQFKLKGTPKVLLSDPDGNFRYDLLPTYKGGRDGHTRSELFYRLREWAVLEYGYKENVEADDVYGYYVGVKGYIGASFDKDCLRGVAGDHFDVYHSRRYIVTTGVLEARNFNMLQTLMGDPVDNIKALPKVAGTPMIPVEGLEEGKRQPFKVTEKIAVALLDEFGWDWKGVLASYKNKGIDAKKALLNRRLVGLDQWTPKKGIKLWTPPKK